MINLSGRGDKDLTQVRGFLMKRITKLFSTKKAFVGYLTVGDGGLNKTYESAKALIAGGVNLLELGVPFSDPVADGLSFKWQVNVAIHNQNYVT